MDSYARLRSIDVSVETADALAPIVESLSPKKQEAFFLWAMGCNKCEVARITGYSEFWVRKIIKDIENAYYLVQ